MRILSALFLIFLSLTFSQCRSGKAIITKAIAPRDTIKTVQTKSATDSLLLISSTKELLQKNRREFKTFSAKIKMDIDDAKGKKPDLLANVRIIKDSVIWISISATILNVEVYRVYINRDSVILLNKQDKEVQYRSLDYLKEIADIPFDFETLQDLIIGNPVFFNEENMTVKKSENFLLVSSTGRDFKELITLSLPDNILQHSKLDDLDVTRNRTASFTYDNYTFNNGIPFSQNRQIIATEKNKLDVRMNFKQFEFNKELSVSFSVPKNYKRK